MSADGVINIIIGIALTGTMAIIGHLLKSLIHEFRDTHKTHNKQILDILERLVRLEERTLNHRNRQTNAR